MPRHYHAPLLMWSWQDAQVEQARLRTEAIADIAAHGFAGTLAMLRGCRYPLSDPLVISAARHAAAAARRRGLAFWFALDPRLDQERLTALPNGRTPYVITGRDTTGPPRCESVVDPDGRYRVRLDYGRPRGQHMLSQVAVTYEPDGLEAVVTYRRRDDGRVAARSLRDVTGTARMFVQRSAGYVEIFGRLDPPPGPGWYVLALPRCTSTYPDLGSRDVVDAVCELYDRYRRAGVHLDGVLWDEIGFVTGYGQDAGRLPWGPAVHAAFAARHGSQLAAALPLLLLDDDDGAAVAVRRDYYAAVQDVVTDAQARCWARARRLWGDDVDSGIHQTWHQNADDLLHGTGDWWRGSAALSGGFTDVGDAERPEVRDEVLAMTVTAAALARHHEHPRAFCNVWGVEYGPELVDWWVHLLSAFGVTWIAHMYGPTSYIDTATGWGPGYPEHPTWDHCTRANAAAAAVRLLTAGCLPSVNVAVVYPVGTLARTGHAGANLLARQAQEVIAGLVRHGVAVDVISPDLFAGGVVSGDVLRLHPPSGPVSYTAVVYPHPQTLQPAELDRLHELRAAGVPTVLVGRPPLETTGGDPVPAELTSGVVPLERLDEASSDLPRLVHAPPGAVANLFALPDGTTTVVVTPVCAGGVVDGEVRARTPQLGRILVRVSHLRGIGAVRFDAAGRPLQQWSRDARIDVATVAGP